MHWEELVREKEIRMTAPGRKSGQLRSVTIWFVRDGDCLGLGTLDDTRAWVKNAVAADSVDLEVGGYRFQGQVRRVADPVAHRRLQRAFAQKYIRARLLSWVGVGQRTTFLVENLTSPEASS